MIPLTLCMIVKDEERFLAGCLESVAGLVDSIVVVDTGSTDATAAIAASHGAIVVRRAWDDDFAAARNAAFEHVRPAKDRFVLVLDADERLTPAAVQTLRRALKRPDFDLGMLPLHDAESLDARPADVVSGRARRGEPVLLPRLMRFGSDLRYEGRVHEQVTTWSRVRGRRITMVDAPIAHYGAVPDLRTARGKADRNRTLLERRAQDEPANPNVRAYLAREYDRAGDPARALAEARAAWAALVASADGGRPSTDPVLPTTMLAYFSIQHGDLDVALHALTTARGWTPAHPNLELLSGLVHERLALIATDVETFARELAAARADYERCLALRGRAFAAEILPGACGTTGATRLATVLLLAGDPRAARHHFESVLHAEPKHVEARLGCAEAWIDEGSAARALPSLESLVADGLPDAWILSAAAAASLGDGATARALGERAREIARATPWIGAWRRGRIDELCGTPAAALPTTTALGTMLLTERSSVSVVIPCFNRFDLLRPVLQGFLREGAGSAFQLVLVDDGSQPPLAELVAELGIANAVTLVRRDNGGRGAALNDGLARATGGIVIVCDSDIVPTLGFVEQHVQFHHENPSELATHLGALTWGVDAGLFGALTGARANPRLRSGASTAPEPRGAASTNADSRGESRDVDWTQWFTDNWSFKRSLFTAHDLAFDVAYRAWGFEELDLARRLQGIGATNSLTTHAQGLHLKPATPEGLRACFVRSLPNLLHLARKYPDDECVHEWLSARADADSVARAERAHEHIWQRALEIDAKHPLALRDVSSTAVDRFAIALSDSTFHLGIARGLIDRPDLVNEHQDLLPPADSSALFQLIDDLARNLDLLEKRLDPGRSPSAWLASVAADLGWDAASHRLRHRWATPITTH